MSRNLTSTSLSRSLRHAPYSAILTSMNFCDIFSRDFCEGDILESFLFTCHPIFLIKQTRKVDVAEVSKEQGTEGKRFTVQYNTIETLMTLPEKGFSVTIIINLQDYTSKR